MSSTTLRITLLASEWNSSKGGLSTMNRELAIHLAKHSYVSVTFFVPKCTEDDKREASRHNITIVEAQERHGYADPIDWLSFPPRYLVIDIIIGHGIKLGKQAQVIMDSHHCKWMQVVHTVPEELAMFKSYSGAIPKGDEKQWTEVKLCEIADLVVAVGPKLREVYSRYLSKSGKTVFNLTPGIFTELSYLKPSTQGSKKFWVLVFGRGDSEDFELKGFDIAAKAVAELNDRNYHLIFVGAPSGNETQVADKLLEQGLRRSQLTVKGYLEKREDLATLLSTANLAIIPSRTEGFGLTALEALSAGLPFLVSQNSGFGEALHEIPSGSSWIVDSEDPEQWAKAIKAVREKGRETALKECQELQTHYAEKYSWEEQCNALLERMLTLVCGQPSTLRSPLQKALSVTEPRTTDISPFQRARFVTEQRTVYSSCGLLHIAEQRTAYSFFSPFNIAEQRRDEFSPFSSDEQRIVELSPFSSAEQRTGELSPFSSAEQSTGELSPFSSAEQRTAELSPFSSAEQRTGELSPFRSAEQRIMDSSFIPVNSAKRRRKDSSVSNIRTSSSNTPPFDSGQGSRPREMPLSSTDLAILGCNVSNDSMQAVRKVFQDIAPQLNLSENPPVENLPPDKAKRYLTRNKLKFCVLVLDAGMFNGAYHHLSKQKVEDLLETAADSVEVKVIILLSCDTCRLTPKDEAIVNETIERIINNTGKGFTVWLEHGRLTVDTDVLVQVMNSKSTISQRNPQTSLSGGGDFQTSTKQPQGAWATPHQTSYSPADTEESTVMLMSKLRNGRISYKPDDLEKRCPGFTVPQWINQILLHEHYNTSVARVKIVKDTGELLYTVEPIAKSRNFSMDDEWILNSHFY